MEYVYKIVNNQGVVEHVGNTNNPANRLIDHKKKGNGSSRGRFYKRDDVRLEVLEECTNRKDAYHIQCQYQIMYGLPTDIEMISQGHLNSDKRFNGGNASIDSDKHNTKLEQTCPYCSKTMKGPTYKRWHGDKCKWK